MHRTLRRSDVPDAQAEASAGLCKTEQTADFAAATLSIETSTDRRLPMSVNTILLIVLVVILLGGGGFYFGR
jgi:hypothetical protein